MIKRSEDELKAHEKIHNSNVGRCSTELKFRQSEVDDAKEAYSAS